METALVMPLVAGLMLTLVQVGLVARDQVLVIHAAREGARAAAVDPDPEVARRAAAASGALGTPRLDVATTRTGGGSHVRVEVTYQAPTEVPLVGHLVGDVALRADATMRVER